MSTWTTQNKRRPGAYINFKSDGGTPILSDSDGIAALMITKQWGPSDQFITVDAGTQFKGITGKDLAEEVAIREALKASREVLVYLPEYEGATKATATTDELVATAKYAGSLGNKISVIIKKQTDDTYTVSTILDNATMDTQEGLTAIPESNAFVDFSGTLPEEDATITLSSGTDGTLTNDAVSKFLGGLDNQEFTHIALGTDDETAKALATAKVRELRGLGRPVFLVTNESAADYEGVISVANGVTLANGEVLAAKDAVYWVAGAQASAGTNSLTYTAYPGAIDTERKNNNETISLLNRGHIVFTFKNDKVVIEQDINTLVTFTSDKNQDFSKNKLVRTMAIIERQVKSLFEESFIGKFPNDLDGRENFKASVITLVLDPLVSARALEYDPEELEVIAGEAKEAVVVNLPLELIDAMEKLYMTVNCR